MTIRQSPQSHCARCGVRDHALGGRSRNGEFLLAIPEIDAERNVSWPRIRSEAWCGSPDGEIQFLRIIRISLSKVETGNGRAALCQHCQIVSGGAIKDLFQEAA